MLLLISLSHADPVTDLCTQEALDARAAEGNARWAEKHMLDLMGSVHTLSEKTELVVDGATLKVGDKVATKGNPGTKKPHATGHPTELRIEKQTGSIACFTKSQHGGDIHNELAVINWDAQGWKVEGSTERVDLKAFADTIHPSYLTVVPPK